MSQFAPEDHQGAIDLVSDGDITFESDRDQDGAGDLVFRTGGVERARIKANGSGTGWPNVLGGSITYVAAPTGSDDTSIIQAAINSAPGEVHLKSGATYKLTGSTGLTLDPSKNRLVGAGSKIDCSGMTSGIALSVVGTVQGFNEATYGGFEGIELAGPGSSSSVTGVKFVGASDTNQNDLNFICSRSTIHDFNVGVEEGSDVWAFTLLGVAIYNCATGIDNATDTFDGGERITYIGCNIFDNTLALNRPVTLGDHHFIACSLDYNGQLCNVVGPGKVFFSDCHIEYSASTTVPIVVSGTNALVVVDKAMWSQATSTTLSSGLTNGVAVTTLPVVKTAVAITSGDTITVVEGTNVDTFTASSDVAKGSTSIPVTSHAPTHDYTTSAKVLDSTKLPANVVTSTASIGLNMGVHFRHVYFTGVVTSSGAFAAGGVQDQRCFVNPALIDGTCINPTTGAALAMPAAFPGRTDFQGPVYQQTTAPTLSAGGTVQMDFSLAAVIEYTITTASAITLQVSNAPGQFRSQDISITIYNNSGGALGAITWPASFAFGGLSWTNPATSKRRSLRATYNPSQGKFVVTFVSSADY